MLTAALLVFLAGSFVENGDLWGEMDRINGALRPGVAAEELESLFEECLEAALSQELQYQFEDLREEAFTTDDFTALDRYVERAAPCIEVVIMGESNAIGVDPQCFQMLAEPGTESWEFFDLALDGFYYHGVLATTSAVWLERGESSAQATVNDDLATAYGEIWSAMATGFTGFYREVALETAEELGGGASLSDSELESYWAVYSHPSVLQLRESLNAWAAGESRGLLQGDELTVQLEKYSGYLGDPFVVLAVDRAPIGGDVITLISCMNPDRIFEAWVYGAESGSGELRGFDESDEFTTAQVEEIAERYRSFLGDLEHTI